MASTKKNLWDAERLALFANANSLAEAESFRERTLDFFPQHFWEYRVGPEPDAIRVWQSFQLRLRESWKEGFPLENCIQLIYSGLGSIWEVMEAHPGVPGLPVWPFQCAVMFLGMESWRARFCAVCGNRFVADKPASRFCGPACSSKARRASRLHWWDRKGEEWRANYKKRKAKKTAKAHRSRRTKR